MNEIDKAVDRQQPVNVTEVQTDVRSNPGDDIENVFNTDGTRMAQNGKIMPKPGLRKNKLVANYRENVKIKPIDFAKCTKSLDDDDIPGHRKMADTQASKAANKWCAQATPYMEYLQQQEKYYIEKFMSFCVMIYTQLCLN